MRSLRSTLGDRPQPREIRLRNSLILTDAGVLPHARCCSMHKLQSISNADFARLWTVSKSSPQVAHPDLLAAFLASRETAESEGRVEEEVDVATVRRLIKQLSFYTEAR